MKTLLHSGFLALLVGGVGCSRLTEPPAEQTFTTAATTTASAPAGAKPANDAHNTIPAVPASAGVDRLLGALKKPEPEGKLEITDIKVGKGPAVKSGDSLTMHYTGTLLDGSKFDSSRDRNKPFDVVIGQGRVIKGWDEGIIGMKVGGRRKLVIPYQMAYGEGGRPPVIPPKATLVFDVELLSIK